MLRFLLALAVLTAFASAASYLFFLANLVITVKQKHEMAGRKKQFSR